MSDITRDNFLQPEIKWGFEITVERKRLWKCLLDMLEAVAEICERHDIPYFLDGGSTLGAARHQGVIPWDDDIDVVLLRKDYDRLEKILQRELPSKYFLQTSATDHEYTITHMKVRDGATSAIPLYHVEKHRVYNMGVFLDIFALDGVPESDRLKARQLRTMKLFKCGHELSVRRNPQGLKNRIVCALARCMMKCVGFERFYRWREQSSARYSTEDHSTLVSGFGEFGYKYLRQRSWFNEVKKVPFEYLTCNVMGGVDAYLEHMFGDWRKPVVGTGNHGQLVFDLDKDYKTKLIEEYGYKAEDFDS